MLPAASPRWDGQLHLSYGKCRCGEPAHPNHNPLILEAWMIDFLIEKAGISIESSR